MRRKVVMLMRDKLKDAEEDANLAFKQFCKSRRELWKVVPWESRVGFEVRDVLRCELGEEAQVAEEGGDSSHVEGDQYC